MIAEDPCPAEAMFDDDLVPCRLSRNHITRWHEGLTPPPCRACKRRDEHTQDCPVWEETTSVYERVRWEGPAAHRPDLSHRTRTLIAEVRSRRVEWNPLDMAMGTYEQANEELAARREHDSAIIRERTRR